MSASLFIDGQWTNGIGTRRGTVVNPATGAKIGEVAFAEQADLQRALEAASRAFTIWKTVSAFERSNMLRKAAALVRERAHAIAEAITTEQGKPLSEALMEANSVAEHIEWNAEEGRRAYGRLIPARTPGVTQMVVKEPVGVVAAFSPWNFPVNQLVRKIAGALAAGCTIIAKAPEETPSSAILLVKCFEQAGFPAGTVNLVFGVPSEISEYLIASPLVAKVSFTGSVPVGRHLGQLSAKYLKRTTMELGGHAPFIVSNDVDPEAVAKLGAAIKFRNAGQVCASPTRFLVQEDIFSAFTEAFVAQTKTIKIGDGLAQGTSMGPLAHARRVDAVDAFVRDAVDAGATLHTGGRTTSNTGFFYNPTILGNVPLTARIMNEEPFGPVAVINSYRTLDEAIAEANRLPHALAAYAFANRLEDAERIGTETEAGTISINHFGHALPEVPFGGFADSGHGSEGGTEGLNVYLRDKFVSRKRSG